MKVAIIGTGSVGANVARHFAQLGVEKLVLVDRGVLKPESVLTHPVTTDAIGARKAEYFGRVAHEISPDTEIVSFDGDITELPPTAFSDVDFCVMATDNLVAETEVGNRCYRWGVPLFHAALHGATMTVQVRCFSMQGEDPPCPACSYGPAELSRMSSEARFSCEGLSQGRLLESSHTQVTQSLGFICATAASLCMGQVLRFRLGLGVPTAETVLEYCAYTGNSIVSPLRRNPRCGCPHQKWTPKSLDAVAESSLRQITELVLDDDTNRSTASGDDPGIDRSDVDEFETTSYQVDDLEFVQRGSCTCGQDATVNRFIAPGSFAGICANCAKPFSGNRFFTFRKTPGGVAAPVLDRPLREITAATPRWVLVQRADEVFFVTERSS